MSLPRMRLRRAFTLIELLVVIAIIAILVALLLPAVQQVREAARKSQCQDHLHNLAVGLADYENPHKQYPPGAIWFRGSNNAAPDVYPGSNGDTMYTNGNLGAGWMVHLLPFVEQKPLYDQYNDNASMSDPSNAAVNQVVREAQIDVYQCPSDTANSVPLNRYLATAGQGPWARGNYGGNIGRERGGGNAFVRWLSMPQDRRGAFGNGRSAAVRDFVDGMSNSVVCWEMRAGATDQDPRGTWALSRLGASLVGGCDNVGDCHGINDPDNGSEDMHGCVSNPGIGMGCWNGGDGQAAPKSYHPGGAQCVLGDAKVTFVSENVDWNVHRALNSIAGGETVRVP